MTELFSTAKSTAKQALKDVWGVAVALTLTGIAVTLITMFFQSLVGMFLDITLLSYGTQSTPQINTSITSIVFTAFFCVFNLLVISNLELGTKAYYFYRSYGEDNDISAAFMYFNSLKSTLKSCGLYVRIFLETAVATTIIFIPFTVTDMLTDMFYVRNLTEADKILLLMVSILSVLMFIVGVIFVLIYVGNFFAVPYAAAANPTLKNGDIIKQSKLAAKGNLSEIFMLKLSFIPACLTLILAVPILYVLPYINMTCSIYARYLLESAGLLPQEDANDCQTYQHSENHTQQSGHTCEEPQPTTEFVAVHSTAAFGGSEFADEHSSSFGEAAPENPTPDENMLNHYFSDWEKSQAPHPEDKEDKTEQV